MDKLQSNYKGSAKTMEMVKNQIRERYGEEEAEKYDPNTNCLPFRLWAEAGYKIKKGEKAIKSITFVEIRDKKDGEVLRKYPKTINLFYRLQVTKAEA